MRLLDHGTAEQAYNLLDVGALVTLTRHPAPTRVVRRPVPETWGGWVLRKQTPEDDPLQRFNEVSISEEADDDPDEPPAVAVAFHRTATYSLDVHLAADDHPDVGKPANTEPVPGEPVTWTGQPRGKR